MVLRIFFSLLVNIVCKKEIYLKEVYNLINKNY